jgi:hypothetical protein
MKTKFLLISLLLLHVVVIVFSQGYKRSIGIGSGQWNYLTDLQTADFGYATEEFNTSGDTIIDTLTYKILNRSCKFESKESYRYGYIREDTVTGKGWFRYEPSSGEFLYYDLNLAKADTFILQSSDGPFLSIVDTVFYENGARVIYFGDDAFNYRFIEGVGSTKSFGKFIYMWSTSTLLCSWLDDVQTYHNPGYDTCYIEYFYDGIRKTETDNIRIFPNPATNKLTVDLTNAGQNINDLKIFDLTGKLLINKRFTGTKTEMDLGELKNGVYILRINNIMVKKVEINRRE